MRRILWLFLALAMLSLCACGAPADNQGGVPSETEAPPPGGSAATSPQGEEPEVQILIYDADDVRVYYLGYADEPIVGPQVKLYVENDKDIEVSVYARDFSANGIMFTIGSDTRVPAGGTARDSICIVDTNFETSGITSVEKVEFSLDVMNAKEKYRNNSDVISIDIKDPGSSGTQPGASPDGSESEIKKLIYEMEDINIYYTGFGFSPADDLHVDFWIENNKSQLIEVTMIRLDLNDVEIMVPSMNQRVAANKSSKGELYIIKPELDEISATGPYQLKFKFKIDLADELHNDIPDFITLDLTE